MTTDAPLPFSRRFVLDVHLGKLARHLRMLGLDTLWSDDYQDPMLLQISRDESRILLTRDRELFEQANPTWRHYVQATDPTEQLLEVIDRFELRRLAETGEKFLTRCLQCNSPILPAHPHQLNDRLPGHVLLEHDEFFLCPRCERVYWKGSHFDRMKDWVRKLLVRGS